MNFCLTMFIVSIVNWVLAFMIFIVNSIKAGEVANFTGEEIESESSGISIFFFVILITIIPLVNIIVTTFMNIVLLMVKDSRTTKQ